jgi:CHRD domain
MNTKTMSVVALVSITLSMTAVVGTLGVIASIHNQANAQQQQQGQEFDARLTGSSEVPPVNTSASGFAELDVEDNGTRLEYDIYVSNIDRVTQAHIHQGNSSQAGPVIAPLFNASTPTGPITGELAEGSIASANLEGPLQGKQLSDLITLMQNGTAYVNVHTEQNPDGEIRGTIEVEDDGETLEVEDDGETLEVEDDGETLEVEDD